MTRNKAPSASRSPGRPARGLTKVLLVALAFALGACATPINVPHDDTGTVGPPVDSGTHANADRGVSIGDAGGSWDAGWKSDAGAPSADAASDGLGDAAGDGTSDAIGDGTGDAIGDAGAGDGAPSDALTTDAPTGDGP